MLCAEIGQRVAGRNMSTSPARRQRDEAGLSSEDAPLPQEQAPQTSAPPASLDLYQWKELTALKDITGVWKQFEEEIKPLLPSGTYELVWPATLDDTFNLLQAQYEVRACIYSVYSIIAH